MTKPFHKKRIGFSLAWLVLAGSASPMSAAHAQDDAESMIARIEAAQSPKLRSRDVFSLQALMEHYRVPGLSVAVVKDFKLHWSKAYGIADKETGRLVDSDTRFQAASISKPVTALAAIHLVQTQRLSLDADVNTILKSWRVPSSELTRNQAVTPRALLSHTSGADDGFGFPGYDPEAPLPTVVQILEGKPPSNVGKVSFARAPFAAFKYSGGGLTIMQLALSEASGLPFADFMQSAVLEPLQMSNSSFEPPQAAAGTSRAALAHDNRGKRMRAPWHIYPEQAAAGLWTTPSDLARFIIEVQTAVRGPNGKILSQQSAGEMTTRVGTGKYAVGLFIDQRGQGRYFSHGGDNWGYRAYMLGHIHKGYGLVIMTNAENGARLIEQVANRIASAYNWDSEDKPVSK